MNATEKALHLYKTRAAAIRNAEKLTAEFAQVGLSAQFIATQKPNGFWTVLKVGA
jgi:hypothetical protein